MKDAMLLEAEILKTKVLTSLLKKENEAVTLKKEVLEKASTINELAKVNEKQKNQVQKMKSLIQPLRDTIVEQATELAQSQIKVGEMKVKVKALEVQVNENEERAEILSRKLEEKTIECLKLGEGKKSMAEVEELLAKVKSDYEDVKKRNLHIEQELEEKKRLKRRMLTFEQHLGDLKSNHNEKHRRSFKEAKVGVKRKNELSDAVSNQKKLKIVEHLKVRVENSEVANEEVVKESSEIVNELDQEETSVEENCPFKMEVKMLSEGESRERMSLVSEKGLWFLKRTVSTSV